MSPPGANALISSLTYMVLMAPYINVCSVRGVDDLMIDLQDNSSSGVFLIYH